MRQRNNREREIKAEAWPAQMVRVAVAVVVCVCATGVRGAAAKAASAEIANSSCKRAAGALAGKPQAGVWQAVAPGASGACLRACLVPGGFWHA